MEKKKIVKVEIARIIGDTPGIAEFCNCKNHRAGILCIFFLYTINVIFFVR